MLAIAVLTARQGCTQDATKLVPTEPAPARRVKQTHNAMYVAPLEIQKDVTFPPKYLAMQTEISKELTSSKVLPKLSPRVRRHLRPMLTYFANETGAGSGGVTG